MIHNNSGLNCWATLSIVVGWLVCCLLFIITKSYLNEDINKIVISAIIGVCVLSLFVIVIIAFHSFFKSYENGFELCGIVSIILLIFTAFLTYEHWICIVWFIIITLILWVLNIILECVFCKNIFNNIGLPAIIIIPIVISITLILFLFCIILYYNYKIEYLFIFPLTYLLFKGINVINKKMKLYINYDMANIVLFFPIVITLLILVPGIILLIIKIFNNIIEYVKPISHIVFEKMDTIMHINIYSVLEMIDKDFTKIFMLVVIYTIFNALIVVEIFDFCFGYNIEKRNNMYKLNIMMYYTYYIMWIVATAIFNKNKLYKKMFVTSYNENKIDFVIGVLQVIMVGITFLGLRNEKE